MTNRKILYLEYAVIDVPASAFRRGKDYGGKTGVTLKEAQDAYIKGFVESAKKKKNTKYKGVKGLDFRFY